MSLGPATSSVAPHIVTLCGDPGGAEAIVPVLRFLGMRYPQLRVDVFAYGHGVAVLRRYGVSHKALPMTSGEGELKACLATGRPIAVLAGTSFNGTDLEKRLIAIARDKQIPTVAVVDFWSHYRERFATEDGKFLVLPDRIAVMDSTAVEAMVALGFPRDNLVETGQPALDAISAITARRAQRLKARRQWRVGGRAFVALYASQPLYFDHRYPNGELGLRSPTVPRILLSALHTFSRIGGMQTVLVYRPHPRDRTIPSIPEVSGLLVRHDSISTRHSSLLGADVVFGMHSMLMVEARALGVPVYSLRSHLYRDQALTGISCLRSRRDILAALKRAFRRRRSAALSCCARDRSAAERVANLLLTLVGMEPSSDA